MKRKVTSLIDPGADQQIGAQRQRPLPAGSRAVWADRQPQLDLNAVGVFQRHKARVAQLPHRGMGDAELVEMGHPCGELSAVCHLEGDVIKAGAPWVKGIAAAARVVAQAEQEAAVLMEQQDPGDPGITGCDLEYL